MGFANTFDSVNSEITDSFSMPVYISPDESKEDTKKISKKKSSNEKKKSEWNPMTEYEDEIIEIAETLNPFWIKFHGRSAVKMLTNYVSNNIKDTAEFNNLSDEQIEDMVDSQIDYVEDFFVYYVERFPDLDEEVVAVDEEDEVVDEVVDDINIEDTIPISEIDMMSLPTTESLSDDEPTRVRRSCYLYPFVFVYYSLTFHTLIHHNINSVVTIGDYATVDISSYTRDC